MLNFFVVLSYTIVAVFMMNEGVSDELDLDLHCFRYNYIYICVCVCVCVCVCLCVYIRIVLVQWRVGQYPKCQSKDPQLSLCTLQQFYSYCFILT
jgi:hypothetical protein